MRRPASVIILLALLPITGVAAQEPVPRGSHMRLMRCNPQCSYVTGTVLGLGEDQTSIVIYSEESSAPLQIQFASISRMEVSRGRTRDVRSGALLGGAALGGLAFWLLNGFTDPCDDEGELACGLHQGWRVGMSVVAAGLGAAIGAMAAPAQEQWEMITPRQLRPSLSFGPGGHMLLGVAVRF